MAWELECVSSVFKWLDRHFAMRVIIQVQMNRSESFPSTYSLLATIEDIIHMKNILIYPLLRIMAGEGKRKYSWVPFALVVVTYMICKTYTVCFRALLLLTHTVSKWINRCRLCWQQPIKCQFRNASQILVCCICRIYEKRIFSRLVTCSLERYLPIQAVSSDTNFQVKLKPAIG